MDFYAEQLNWRMLQLFWILTLVLALISGTDNISVNLGVILAILHFVFIAASHP